MSETTNLKLFKHDNVETNTNKFDIDKSLNENWDKIDDCIGEINQKEDNQDEYIIELQAENARLKQDLNSLPSEQVEGESIDISDSAEMRFTEFKVYGNSKQDEEPSPDYPSEVKSCGDNVNVFDGVFESGDLNSVNGTNESNNDRIRSVNYLELKSNETYTFTPLYPTRIIEYDANKQFVKCSYGVSSLTTSKTTKYIRFSIISTDINLKEKVVEGTVAGAYSPYGQGCINEVICNRNLFNLGEDNYTNIGLAITLNKNNLTINGTSATGNALVTKGNMTGMICLGKFKAGTYIASCKVVSGSYNTGAWTKYFYNGEKQSLGDFERGNNTMVITLEEDTNVYFQVWCAAQVVFSNYSMDIQLEKGSTATELVEHQSQLFPIPTQQPMLEGDYFDRENKEEVHNWGEYIFTGDESFSLMSSGSNETQSRFTWPLNTIKKAAKMKCNMLPQVSQSITINEDEEILQLRDLSNDDMISIVILNSRLSEVSAVGFTNYLKSLYDAGTPMYIRYELATQIRLPLTGEQNKILEELENAKSYKGVTHIYSTDEVEPNVEVTYKKDMQIENEKLQSQIDEIKQLLSTTQTSALLLDNLQTDIESEVE